MWYRRRMTTSTSTTPERSYDPVHRVSMAFEREGDDPEFFFHFSPNGYAVGLNSVLYAMTH